jgi:site-specific DNA recombinase
MLQLSILPTDSEHVPGQKRPTRFQAEYTKLQNRIDAMYVDKLDGRIDVASFDRMAAAWRGEQAALLDRIREHQAANQTYLEDGVQLLELARRTHELFTRQEPSEKRRLLNFVLSNCTWKDKTLTADYRQPFDLIAVTNKVDAKTRAAEVAPSDPRLDWLPGPDSNQRPFG